MTPPNDTISPTALRHLLTAAADAGVSALVSPASVRVDGDRLAIRLSSRDVRALTNWFEAVALREHDAPIAASTIPDQVSPTSTEDWMSDALSERDIPLGYVRAHIPSSRTLSA